MHEADMSEPTTVTSKTDSSTSSSSRSTSVSGHTQFRSVSLANCTRLSVEGSVAKNGIVVADCDNDQQNELVVGTLGGDLLVFKDNQSTPHASEKDLGMICVVLVGDILNDHSNYILALSIEGYLSVFSLAEEPHSDLYLSSTLPVPKNPKFPSPSSAPISAVKLPPTIADNEVYSASSRLALVHGQQIQANAMCGLVVDLDGDGQNELVLALSDRVVRTYRASTLGHELKLVALTKWELADQISSLCLATDHSAPLAKSLIVSQQGGLYARIAHPAEGATEEGGEAQLVPQYCRPLVASVRNPQSSAELCGDIRESSGRHLVGVATHDGLLSLLSGDQVVWQSQLEQNVLSLQSLRLRGEGGEAGDHLLVCGGNGLLYVVGVAGQTVTCHLGQPVSAFKAGEYHVGGSGRKCLVAGTFTHSLLLFLDVDSPLSVTAHSHSLPPAIEHHPSLPLSLAALSRHLPDHRHSPQPDPRLLKCLLYDILC